MMDVARRGILMGGAALAAAPRAFGQADGMAAQAQAMLAAAYESEGPGASAVISKAGQVIWSGARGFADVAARRPNRPDTVFRTGSITKQFAAATVLTLVAEGRISLDDPVSKFLPAIRPPSDRATVRQLLNHSSGVQDFSKIPNLMGTERTARPWTTEELVALTASYPAVAAPGEKWEYNNGGYVLVGAIIEQVTGRPWHEAVVERVGRPLGLATLAYAGANEGDPARARPYADPRATPAHMSVAHAAGGLVISPVEMTRWADALHRGRVLSPALYQEMTRPARLNDGSTQPYGFGLRLRRVLGKTALIHGGAGRGVDTSSIYLPESEVAVAVFANSDVLPNDASTLAQRLAALALGSPYPTLSRADFSMSDIEPLFGTYTATSGPPLRFFARDGRLYLGRGPEDYLSVPTGGDRFMMGPDPLFWFQFTRRADGAHALEVHPPENGEPTLAVRTGPPPALLTVPTEVLRSYAGSYVTETVTLVVNASPDGRLSIGPRGEAPLPLRPLSQTEFVVEDGAMRIVFHPENGRVDRLTVHRGARVLNGKRSGSS